MGGQIEFSANNTLKINFLFLSVLIYLLLTALNISDEMMFSGSGSIELPILGHNIGLNNFMILMPILVLAFHFYFLIHLRRHFLFLKRESSNYPSFFNLYHLEDRNSNKSILLFLIIFSTILFPLSLQALFFVILLKFQNLTLSIFESLIILAEILLIYKFRYSTTFNFSNQLNNTRKLVLFLFLGALGVLVISGILQLSLLFYNKYNSFPFKLHFEINRSSGLSNKNNINTIIKNRNLKYLQIKNTSVQNFTFFNVDLANSEIVDDSLINVDFVNCSSLSSFKRSQLVNVRFLESNFRNSIFETSEFLRCSFYDCTFLGDLTIEGVVFEDTSFKNLILPSELKCEAVRINNVFYKKCNSDDFK